MCGEWGLIYAFASGDVFDGALQRLLAINISLAIGSTNCDESVRVAESLRSVVVAVRCWRRV